MYCPRSVSLGCTLIDMYHFLAYKWLFIDNMILGRSGISWSKNNSIWVHRRSQISLLVYYLLGVIYLVHFQHVKNVPSINFIHKG